MMNKISAVYKIVNTITGDCYVGSSKDVERRWAQHKRPSRWSERPNSLLYRAFQKYGVYKFRFQILAPVMEEYLKQVEEEFIEMLEPAYNNIRAKGLDVERRKESKRKSDNRHNNQLCSYNGETLTLAALSKRFNRAGIKNPTEEAKKYLIGGYK